MGLFRWLKEILFGGMPQRPAPRPTVPPSFPGPQPRPTIPPSFPGAQPRTAPPAAKAAPRPAPRKGGDYTAEEFAPISDKELRQKSKASEVATSPWWGRTDTIPPGEDARTKLIDRALVTRGYLTPE